MNPRPIGLFDSGVGGLSVWREVARRLPDEDLVYYADQAHCPYGNRPPAEICSLSVHATDFLLRHDAKVIVVACNTACAAALDLLRARYPDVPFVGMEPAIKPAAARSRVRKIGVLATRGTLAGDLFARTRGRLNVEVIAEAAEGLVEKVEAGELDSPETLALVRRAVEPLCAAGVDEIVLGCTHYPFLAPLIGQVAGPGIRLQDPSAAVARQVERIVEERSWRRETPHALNAPHWSFYTSGDPQAFGQVMEKLIGVHNLVLADSMV
jgi:glutamate racemase